MDLRSLFKHAEESPWCTLLHGLQFSADLPLSLQKPPSLIRLAILNWISFTVSFFLFISICLCLYSSIKSILGCSPFSKWDTLLRLIWFEYKYQLRRRKCNMTKIKAYLLSYSYSTICYVSGIFLSTSVPKRYQVVQRNRVKAICHKPHITN